jgi:hypothetical protein
MKFAATDKESVILDGPPPTFSIKKPRSQSPSSLSRQLTFDPLSPCSNLHTRPSSSRRLTVAEAERIRGSFYTWQRDGPPVALTSSPPSPASRSLGASSQLFPPYSTRFMEAAAPSCGVSVSIQQTTSAQSALPAFRSVNDFDSFLFNSSPHSSQAGSLETQQKTSRGKHSQRSHNPMWAHRAAVQGALPEQTSALKTSAVSYNSPKHLERSLEAQLAHVGRLDAALEAKRFRHSPSTPRRWL